MKDFIVMRDKHNEHFNKMVEECVHLFETDVDKDYLWEEKYLGSFPKGTNPIFRERTEHDCSCCKSYIRSVGNVIGIKDDLSIVSIWDFITDSTYQPVMNAMSEYVKSKPIKGFYFRNKSEGKRVGTMTNFENTDGKVIQWDHFYFDIPNVFLKDMPATLNSEYVSRKDVFKRSLDEISMSAIESVLDLINNNSIYRGEEFKPMVVGFKKFKKEYETIANDLKDNYCWKHSVEAGNSIGKIRNHAIGTLLTDLSEGKDLEQAVNAFEKMVAPTNYKRSKPIFTQRMLDEAKKTITELGYLESLPRRFAHVDDIRIGDILYANKDVVKRMGEMDIFEKMSKGTKQNNKSYARAEGIRIEDFISKVLPSATDVEMLFECKHENNLMSLVAPQNANTKSMFKWDNNFSWAYNGNVTDSMKERVKSFGGKVDGDLRFSIQWNTSGDDNSDLDAHCIEASEEEIYYGHKCSRTNGELDVDIIQPKIQAKDGIAVENITWNSRRTMIDGNYRFFVNQYCGRNSQGFTAEIEFDGKVYKYNYPYPVRGNVDVATVTLKDGVFTIKHHLNASGNDVVKDVWGIKTNTFIPVSVVCLSPNHWSKNGVGNKHYFFMLKDCINPDNPNGMYNEFLCDELGRKHRKVMEAMGSMLKVENDNDQLSGLGFSSTKHDELIIKVNDKPYKVII